MSYFPCFYWTYVNKYIWFDLVLKLIILNQFELSDSVDLISLNLFGEWQRMQERIAPDQIIIIFVKDNNSKFSISVLFVSYVSRLLPIIDKALH